MLSFLRKNRQFLFFLLLITLYFCIVFVGTDFYRTPHKDVKDLMVLVSQWMIVSLSSFSLLYLISINKTVFKICFPILVFLCSILAYFRFAIGISLTPNLLQSAFDNDLKTSLDLLNLPLIVFVLVNIIMVIILIKIRKCIHPFYPKIHLTIAGILLFFTAILNTRITAPVQHRIPFSIAYSVKNYLENKKVIQSNRPDISKGTTTEIDTLTVVYVQGESLRADHLHVNGYTRQTTPLLEQDSIISFSNIYNPYTTTDQSVPYILTDADSLHPDYANSHRSFINYFNHCDYVSYWIANQEPATAFIYFTNEADHTIHINNGKTVYNFEPYSWLDTQMDSTFDVALNGRASKKLIILHAIGSHWWYKAHYTPDKEVFRPVIESRNVPSSSTEQLINTYDNTILETDFFLDGLIQKLKNKKAVLIYLSDHGEALGENGHWLHGTDATPIHHPACLVWMSDSYKKEFPTYYDILNANKNKYFNSAFLFHSILDAAKIKTRIFAPQLSIFRPH